MKKLTFALALAMATSMSAQTVNYALDNPTGTGRASVCTLTELNNAQEMTLQMWIRPNSYSQAQLIRQDNFSLELTTDQKLKLTTGDRTATIDASGLLNQWTQVTWVINHGAVTAYLNNQQVAVTGDAQETLSASAYQINQLGCVLGKGLKGKMDEIRVWSSALKPEDFYWRNTLNRFNPDDEHLVAYWKCDQNLCDQLFDYKLRHHGEIHNLKKAEVTDNAQFRYRVASGYTSLMRFLDRKNIDKNMFRMTNDVIILSGRIQDDGSLMMEYPDNSLTPTQAGYMESFEGRQGVMTFEGTGAGMTAADSRLMGDPRDASGYGPSTQISVGGWVYIDTWQEGAAIMSQYKDADNCFVVSLGKKDEQEVTVNVCGTTASLKGKLTAGKWQYLTVYLNASAGSPSDPSWEPIKIGVGEMDGGSFTSAVYGRTATDGAQVEMGGKDMTISKFPNLQGATFTLGKDFSGKMDEVMVWASDRSGNMKNDATVPYQWNIGSWPNVFLNAYWKGDDPENPGKDSQSFCHMTDIIRGYFDQTRGAKVRLGIIYQGGEKWKTQILNNEAKLDNLIRDLKTLITYYDGVDVDLEWMYSPSDWSTYNHVVERIANEVMPLHPGKSLTCSLHYVSYNGFNKSLLPHVDYFTFQLYGPNVDPSSYSYYTNSYNKFIEYGFPKDKILLSYSILTQEGVVEGYKDVFEKYGLTDAQYTPDLTSWNCGGTVKKFNSTNLVKRKQEYIHDNDVRGTMYFDMGNDLNVSDPRSLIHAQNEALASNVDTLVREVDLSHVVPGGIDEGEDDEKILLDESVFSTRTQEMNLERAITAADLSNGTYDGKKIILRGICDTNNGWLHFGQISKSWIDDALVLTVEQVANGQIRLKADDGTYLTAQGTSLVMAAGTGSVFTISNPAANGTDIVTITDLCYPGMPITEDATAEQHSQFSPYVIRLHSGNNFVNVKRGCYAAGGNETQTDCVPPALASGKGGWSVLMAFQYEPVRCTLSFETNDGSSLGLEPETHDLVKGEELAWSAFSFDGYIAAPKASFAPETDEAVICRYYNLQNGIFRFKSLNQNYMYVDDDKGLSLATTAPENNGSYIFRTESLGSDLVSISTQSHHINPTGTNTQFVTTGGTVIGKYKLVYFDDATGTGYAFQCQNGTNSTSANPPHFYLHDGNSGGGISQPNVKVWGPYTPGSRWTLEPVESFPITISEALYATANYDFSFALPQGVTAYTGSLSADGSYLELEEVTGGIVPAQTPVILSAETAGTYQMPLVSSEVAEVATNDLRGTYLTQDMSAVAAYILGQEEGEVAFYRGDGTTLLPANKAYLPAGNNQLRVIRFGDHGGTTHIADEVITGSSAVTFYDLQGRKVEKPTRGIYVTSTGKKVFFNK